MKVRQAAGFRDADRTLRRWFTPLAGALFAAGIVAGLGACGRFSIDPPPPVALEQAPRGDTLAWDQARAAAAAEDRAVRHRTFVSEGIPVEYVNRANPVPPTHASIATGGRLYAARCAGCHDPRGLGYGEQGRDLTLPPAILAAAVEQPKAVDQYLMWAIA
ncbi:MAG: cytochrome c [Inquilinus sp.]|nr:cytochrome c [Inquilinus sp.]